MAQHGFPGIPGQSPVGPPIPFSPPGPADSPTGIPPQGPPPDLFGIISQLAARERPNTLDKMRQVVDLLEEVRELDPKIASVASMMIHLARNGQTGLSDFQDDSSGKTSEGKLGAGGVVGGV